MRKYPRKHKQNYLRIVALLKNGQKSTREIYDYLSKYHNGMTINELNKILPKYFIKVKQVNYTTMGGYSHSYIWKNKGENINGSY